MKNLLNLFLNTAKSKVMPLWTKLRLWTSAAFLKATVLTKVREFFTKLLDVRPRDKRDYYSVFRWLVSKRLAFALVVGLAICAVIYIATMLPAGLFESGQGGVRTYKYRSLPLKFCSGEVNILARDGHLAYSGQVDRGAAEGQGTLFSRSGDVLYEGQFSANMYEGSGVLYYPNGTPQYVGGFSKNLYTGAGKSYRPNGVMDYEGQWVMGVRSGLGTLYNSVGNQVFSGEFLDDRIVFTQFLDRPTTELPSLYTGDQVVYQSDTEYAVTMMEIGIVCAVEDGSTKLENEWTVTDVYVLTDTLAVDGARYSTINEINRLMGEPLYYGTAWVNLSEAAAINQQAGQKGINPVTIQTEAVFDDVLTVLDYDRDYQTYLYTFEKDGLLYTFYTAGAGQSDFFMYSISRA